MPACRSSRCMQNCVRVYIPHVRKGRLREDAMKGHAKPIILAIVAGGGAAYAANETVTMNAIDAGGIGKEIGTLELSKHRSWFAGYAAPGRLTAGRPRFPCSRKFELRSR